jgi:hypothetical protein
MSSCQGLLSLPPELHHEIFQLVCYGPQPHIVSLSFHSDSVTIETFVASVQHAKP